MPLWLSKILTKNNKKEDVNRIPDQFEFIETQYWFKDRPEVPVFVTILDKFVHYYSNETMYHIRIERVGCMGSGLVEYETVDEEHLRRMLEKKKE